MSLTFKVLIIGKVWPEPSSSAAGTRMMQLIRLFKGSGCKVIFCTTAKPTEYSNSLSKEQIETHSIELNHSSFDDFIRSVNPDIVLYDRFMTEEQFAWRVRENCPDALTVLNTEDLHFIRKARQLALKNKKDVKDYFTEDFTLRELASIHRSDLCLVISDFERKLVSDLFHIDPNKVIYFPLAFSKEEIEAVHRSKKFSERHGFVFIGNFLHEPNVDAVKFLKHEIWPGIRKELKDAKCHIYGAYAPESVLQMNNTQEGFLVHGRAEDASDEMVNARVNLAPLRFGAGLKGKIFDGFLTGTPCICTSVAAEGMFSEQAWPGLVKNDPKDFILSAVELYQNEILWNEKHNTIETYLMKNFSWEDLASKLMKEIEDKLNELSDLRRLNIIGAILWQEQLNSTKYMSRWIEAKNRQDANS